MIEAYPLCWPEGWPRTQYPKRSKFWTSFAVVRDSLIYEIDKLGGINEIISTNVPLRQDGLPYARAGEPDDPGVAVYFEYCGKPMCFACDKYDLVRDNMQAIRKTIEALRGIERWGASDMMERAFAGFAAITDQSNESWRDILDYYGDNLSAARDRYRYLAKQHHPDLGGNSEEFHRIQKAWEQAQSELS